LKRTHGEKCVAKKRAPRFSRFVSSFMRNSRCRRCILNRSCTAAIAITYFDTDYASGWVTTTRDDSRGFRTFLRDTLPRSLINDRFR